MEPATTITIILSIVGIIAGGLAHARFRSKCHLGDVLDISIHKEPEKKPDDNILSSISDSES